MMYVRIWWSIHFNYKNTFVTEFKLDCNTLNTIFIVRTIISNSIYIIIGDLNVNVLNHPNPLADSLDILNLTNILHGPTCFKNVDNPTFPEVILTNTPRRRTSDLNM